VSNDPSRLPKALAASELPETLASSAQRWARRALEAHTKGDIDEAGHDAAVALEHLIKARLAADSPVLIADGRDFETLLHLTGNQRHANRPLSRIRTVSLREAAQRVRRISPTWRFTDDELAPLIGTRDGVTHAALWDQAEAAAALPVFLRAVVLLCDEMGLAVSEFWGDYASLVSTLLEDAADTVRRIVATKKAAAATALAARLAGLSPELRDGLLLGMEAAAPFRCDHAERHPCPVCGRNGWLGGDSPEPDWDRHGIDTDDWGWVPEPVMVFLPACFQCGACGLALDFPELVAAGLPEEVELRDMELPDMGYEPDEDWERGR
jgi:hypothetical protein